MTIDMPTIIAMICIPSIVSCLCLWLIQRGIKRRDSDREKLEEARKANEDFLIQGLCSTIGLGEATANAVKELNPNCNGEMSRALEYARDTKDRYKDFLRKLGIEYLH